MMLFSTAPIVDMKSSRQDTAMKNVLVSDLALEIANQIARVVSLHLLRRRKQQKVEKIK
jgi:hypothetical protein